MKHLPAYAACLFFRLWLCGWNPQHAEEYRNAIGEIRKLGDPHVVAPHLLNYSSIQWYSSEYRESLRSYADGMKMWLDVDSVHPSLSGIRWGPWQLSICLILYSWESGARLFGRSRKRSRWPTRMEIIFSGRAPCTSPGLVASPGLRLWRSSDDLRVGGSFGPGSCAARCAWLPTPVSLVFPAVPGSERFGGGSFGRIRSCS